MRIFHFLLSPGLILLLTITTVPVQILHAHEEDDVVKVVYHADFSDPRRFSAMLTSINNMATYYTQRINEGCTRKSPVIR